MRKWSTPFAIIALDSIQKWEGPYEYLHIEPSRFCIRSTRTAFCLLFDFFHLSLYPCPQFYGFLSLYFFFRNFWIFFLRIITM